jgi:hypothetical protein
MAEKDYTMSFTLSHEMLEGCAGRPLTRAEADRYAESLAIELENQFVNIVEDLREIVNTYFDDDDD